MYRRLFSVMIALVLCGSIVCTVGASGSVTVTSTELEAMECQAYVDMKAYIESTDLPMIVEDFTLQLRDDIDISDISLEEFRQLLAMDVANLQAVLSEATYELDHQPSDEARVVYNGNGEYTSKVWAGIPAIGLCSIKQDFRATVTNGMVRNAEKLGPAYMTGVSWGQYNHVRTWFT